MHILNIINESEEYKVLKTNFNLKQPTNDYGYWVNDILECKIKCKTCHQKYKLYVDTYHGFGSFTLYNDEYHKTNTKKLNNIFKRYIRNMPGSLIVETVVITALYSMINKHIYIPLLLEIAFYIVICLLTINRFKKSDYQIGTFSKECTLYEKIVNNVMHDVKKKYKQIWNFAEYGAYDLGLEYYTVHYEFKTNKELNELKEKGILDEINKYHKYLMEKYGYPIEYIKDCNFATKEDCDRECNGNWFQFYR